MTKLKTLASFIEQEQKLLDAAKEFTVVPVSTLSDLQVVCSYKYDYYQETIRTSHALALEALRLLSEAMQSVACACKPEQLNKEYWMLKTSEETADVLAQDTHIARCAIAEVEALLNE